MQIEPLCAFCKHVKPEGKCAAFPKGIPNEIFITGEHDHHQPFPGDNGIKYEPAKSTKAEQVAA